MNAIQQFESFEEILGNATIINTGFVLCSHYLATRLTLHHSFIVLEHDLFEITVDLAVGYTLNAAMTHNPPFTLKPIGQCSNIPTTDMYMETTTNQSYIAARKAALAHTNETDSTGTQSNVSTGGALANAALGMLPFVSALVAAGVALVL